MVQIQDMWKNLDLEQNRTAQNRMFY